MVSSDYIIESSCLHMSMYYNFNDGGLYATSLFGSKDWNDLFYWLCLGPMIGIFWWFQVQTIFPKTSYATWEEGNKEKKHVRNTALVGSHGSISKSRLSASILS